MESQQSLLLRSLLGQSHSLWSQRGHSLSQAQCLRQVGIFTRENGERKREITVFSPSWSHCSLSLCVSVSHTHTQNKQKKRKKSLLRSVHTCKNCSEWSTSATLTLQWRQEIINPELHKQALSQTLKPNRNAGGGAARAFNASTQEAEQVNLRVQAWSMDGVPGQPRLHRETQTSRQAP